MSVASGRIAQVYSSPTEISANAPPGIGPQSYAQHVARPSSWSPHASSHPTLICRNVPDAGVGGRFRPQHSTVSSGRIPHVVSRCELIVRKVPAGELVSPLSLRPQQVTVPSVFNPQLNLSPAVTSRNVPAGGDDSPWLFSPQQASVLSVRIAQAWASFAPTATLPRWIGAGTQAAQAQLAVHVCVPSTSHVRAASTAQTPSPLHDDHEGQLPPSHARVCVPQFPHGWVVAPSQVAGGASWHGSHSHRALQVRVPPSQVSVEAGAHTPSSVHALQSEKTPLAHLREREPHLPHDSSPGPRQGLGETPAGAPTNPVPR